MKNIYVTFLCFFLFSSVFSQNLNLSDLQTICGKTNWEYVNQYLLNKGWEYYSSEKGSSDKYHTITWSYKKSSYEDKAQAWFYLYTYEGYPNKVSYAVFSKEAYQKIQNSLSGSGYRLEDNSIEDDKIINNYGNSSYLLTITTQKRADNDYSYTNDSFTAYSFLLIKKNGIYDPGNGDKIVYFEDSTSKEVEYTLKDGKFEGFYKLYHRNGNLSKTGTYRNDKKVGEWKEYDVNGNIEAVYTMKNDEFSGNLKVYEDNKLSEERTYANNKLNGLRTFYYYNDSDILFLKKQIEYSQGLEQGKEEIILIDDDKSTKVLSLINYNNGIKEGFFQEADGDSLIIGNYKNDKLHGTYKIYHDTKRMLVGGVIDTDTTNLTIRTHGKFNMGLKNGQWKYYDLTGALIEEGSYINDKKNGVWLDYYMSYGDGKGNKLPYSNKLYLSTTYKDDKKNGETISYSSLDKIKIECDDKNRVNDVCYKHVYRQELSTYNYRDDKLNGAYISKDSLGQILTKGAYNDNQKDGPWLESYILEDGETYTFLEGNYNRDDREGTWIQYIDKNQILVKCDFEDDMYQGEYILYNSSGQPNVIKEFNRDKLKNLKAYDAAGENITKEYSIRSETIDKMKVSYTQFTNNRGKVEINYLMMKPESEIDHEDFMDIFHQQIEKDKNSYMDGLFLLTTEDGSILMKGNMSKDIKTGTWEFHYPDQNVKIMHEYSDMSNIPNSETYNNRNDNSLFNGDFIFVNEDTKEKEERRIRDGLRNGTTQYFDAQGNKTKKEKYKDGIIKE